MKRWYITNEVLFLKKWKDDCSFVNQKEDTTLWTTGNKPKEQKIALEMYLTD